MPTLLTSGQKTFQSADISPAPKRWLRLAQAFRPGQNCCRHFPGPPRPTESADDSPTVPFTSCGSNSLEGSTCHSCANARILVPATGFKPACPVMERQGLKLMRLSISPRGQKRQVKEIGVQRSMPSVPRHQCSEQVVYHWGGESSSDCSSRTTMGSPPLAIARTGADRIRQSSSCITG